MAMVRSRAPMTAVGRLRIVGGQWRGRRLPVPDRPGLRPTPDRVRETLFNWLAPWIAGARCLDAFAGSGALGFEARSRGAGAVVMIERDPVAARQLQANARALEAAGIEILRADALAWLESGPSGGPFDLVFLDPPFADGLLAPALDRLARPGWLAPGARVYLEAPLDRPWPPLPAGWMLTRDRTAGRIRYALACRQVHHASVDQGSGMIF